MKKLLLIAISFCFIANIGFSQTTLEVAQKQYESGDYLLAIQNYLKSKDGSGYSFQSCIQIARCYDALGINEKAYSWYKRAKKTNPNDYQYDMEIGKVAMKDGDYNNAKVYFSNYAFIDSEMSEYFIGMVNNANTLRSTSLSSGFTQTTQNNTLANEFAPFIYNDKLYMTLDVKNVNLSKQAMQLVENPGSSIVCDENNNPLLGSLFIKSNISPFAISASNHIAYSKYPSKCQAFKTRRENSVMYTASLSNGQMVNIKPFPYNKIGYSITDPYLSEDGMTLYFSADLEGGYGGYDLYYSINNGGKWSKPVNLGGEVNTIGNEITPHIDGNNKLYFASDFHYGLGGYDIFEAQYVLGEWMNIQNSGQSVNSCGDDYFPFVDQNQNVLYFTSNRTGNQGGEDIYSTLLPERDVVIDFSGEPTIALVSEESVPVEETIQIESKMDEDIPSAIYIGDYEPRTISQPIAQVPNKTQNNIPVKWEVKMERAAVPKFIQMPSKEVAATDIPPAFKIPEIRTNSSESTTLINYEGAKLVSVGEVVEKPISSVYFVQLAAFYTSSGNINAFESLSSLGNIYKVFAGTAVKVRLGYFNDHASANEVLARVRKMGYKDAFLVNTDLNTANMELIYSNFDHNNNIKSNTRSSNTTPEESSNNFEYTNSIDHNSSQEYKVRLASYEDPIWFESSKIKDLGQLEQWSKGSWTIFILSGYHSYEEAEQARIKAVNRGYADAEVVIDNQGIIERLKKN